MQTESNSLGAGLPEKATSPPVPTSTPFLHLCHYSIGNLFTTLSLGKLCRPLTAHPTYPLPKTFPEFARVREIIPCMNFCNYFSFFLSYILPQESVTFPPVGLQWPSVTTEFPHLFVIIMLRT